MFAGGIVEQSAQHFSTKLYRWTGTPTAYSAGCLCGGCFAYCKLQCSAVSESCAAAAVHRTIWHLILRQQSFCLFKLSFATTLRRRQRRMHHINWSRREWWYHLRINPIYCNIRIHLTGGLLSHHKQTAHWNHHHGSVNSNWQIRGRINTQCLEPR